mmetsp:Transcript_93192/g.259594  ORF Transcript_93192/g.259594 Transcript_93192/m.259594 type:complete len:188 (+) Transcript_93192:98-661(+)
MAASPVVHNVRLALRAAGAAVCLVLTALGIALFAQPKTENLFRFSHWLSEGLVFVIAGLLGAYWAYTAEPARSRYEALKAGLGSAVFYFWLGCCIIGEVGGSFLPQGKLMSTLGCALGFLAWSASAGSLVMMFFADAESGTEEERQSLLESGDKASSLPKAAGAEDEPAPPPGGWNNLAGIGPRGSV